ncbi:MAG: hypothetical protein QOJ00_80 [Actinomycetota bacterium]
MCRNNGRVSKIFTAVPVWSTLMSSRGNTTFVSRAAAVVAVVLVASLVAVARPAEAALLSPTLNSVSPNRVVPGVNNQKLKLGGDFTSGSATVAFTPATGITIVGGPTTVSTNEIDVTVNVAADAPYTQRDVTVTQGPLGSSSTCAKCLTVGPDITNVSGPLSNQGASGTFTITGHGFKPGSAVKIERKNYGFGATETDSVNASDVVVSAPATGNVTTINATVTTLNRAAGRWQVTVIGPDGVTATFGDGSTTGLQIAGQQPTLSHLSPARVDPSQTNLKIDLVGDGFAQGLTATVSGSGITQSAKAVITDRQHASITFNSASTLTSGPRTLVLRNADGQSSENTEALCANCDLSTPGSPTITSVTPSAIGRGASNVEFIVTGTNFGSLPQPTVTPNDADPTKKITVTATRDSSTQITLSVSTGAATPDGARDLSIAFQSGSPATKASAFTVTSGFDVFSVTPAGRPRGYNGTIQVNGSGFSGAPTVAITPATDVTVGTVTVDSPSRLTVNVSVGPAADPTTRNLSVTQAGTTKTCTGCFTVGNPPTVTSISPTTGNGGGQVAVSVTGTNFAPDPTVTLERAGQAAITMTSVNRESATKISGTFDLTNAAPGAWDVKVTNADGGVATKAGAFTVVLPSPTVTSSSPDTVSQAKTNVKLVLTGTSFAPGMVVSIPQAAGVTVTDVTRTSTTSATATVATSDNATLGSRDVTVTNTDGKSGTCTSCFDVTQGTQAKNFGPGVNAYDNFSGGAFVASGNLDGVASNGVEFITGANAGGGPHVRPFRVNPANGNIQAIGDGFMAYATAFTGGVRVAVGNIDGNTANGDEIVTAAGPGGGPHVRVLRLNSDLSVSEPFGGGFMAYAPSFAGGVWVATGDVNGDGKDEIITGAGAGGGPHVRVWTLAPGGQSFTELAGWMAYSTQFAGGVAVAAGNVFPEASDKPQLDEVVTVPGQGGGPHTRITTGAGDLKSEFMAFDSADDNGYRVTVGDFDFDTIADVAVGRGSSSELYITQVTQDGPVPLVTPNPAPFGNLSTGTNLAAADVDGDGDSDLVIAPDHSGLATIRLIRPLSAT